MEYLIKVRGLLKSAVTGIGSAMMLCGIVSFVLPSIITMTSITALSATLSIFFFYVTLKQA